MATIDHARDHLVVRIVYDGPGRAGKTTSLAKLSQSLDRTLFSGDSAAGRTLYFDWLDHLGGQFDGRPIRSQVVSVPGQPALVERRLRLLDSADAVVFVLGSQPEDLDRGIAVLKSLRERLASVPTPAPRIIVQANKRDEAGAVSLPSLRARLGGGPDLEVIESTAIDGRGVRETFVLAVRLALERVRAMAAAGVLPEGAPEVEDGPELLRSLKKLASGTADTETGPRERYRYPQLGGETKKPRSGTGPAQRPSSGPKLPDATVASSMIWPVEGRSMMQSFTAKEPVLHRLQNGDWQASAGAWRLHSELSALFSTPREARAALADWARWHVDHEALLSPRRFLVVARAAPKAWRLWQGVHQDVSLEDLLRKSLTQVEPRNVANDLVRLAEVFSDGIERMARLRVPWASQT